MPERQFTGQWELPGIGTIYELRNHGVESFSGRSMWQFSLTGRRTVNFEMFASPGHAIVAAVAAKYTGERGAGGTGVGTAADWFMRMVEADRLVAADDPADVIAQALRDSEGFPAVSTRVYAGRVVDNLGAKGHVVARINDS